MIRSATRLKVLMIADVFPPSICGIGDYTDCLARAMKAKDVDVTVLTKVVDGAPDEETRDGVTVRRIARRWSLSERRHVLDVADELGPGTVIHVQYPSLTGYHRGLMINLLPAFLKVTRRRHPVVVTMHGFHEHRLRWRARVTPMLLAHDALVFVHACDYAMVGRWIHPPTFDTSLIPIASNVPEARMGAAERRCVRQEIGFNDGDRVVVFFGEIREDKGLHDLLDALAAVKSRGLAVRLLVISASASRDASLRTPYQDDVLTRLEAAVRDGWAVVARADDADRAARLLAASDIAAFPFTMGASENRGSLLAAVVNRLPVITTRGPSTPERFEEEYGVETVPSGDVAALATRLAELVGCDATRDRLAGKASSAACRLSWDGVAERMIDVYRSCQR